MMMKDLGVDENMSNMTSAASSTEISASRSGTASLYPQQSSTSTTVQEPPQNKRKRNLPGHPDPEAEVIALSPKTLVATNRFVCDVCNKGFQRDQNLQLHRRGHNLPWKLKQRSKQEIVRKKVYVCPEPTCVHHEPARALGDLTGIKKHFFRKHGEKKWKCDKCSKKYAVQSDWKAHFKICGTREYKCECGTVFSRRDSYIAHRAFCDALAQESIKGHHHHHLLLHAPPPPLVKKELHETNYSRPEIPSWFSYGLTPPPPPNQNPNPTTTLAPPHNHTFQLPVAASHHHHHHRHMMSATALLQRASAIGATSSSKPYPHAGHVPPPAAAYNSNNNNMSILDNMHSREEIGTELGPFPSHEPLLASSEKPTTTTTTAPNTNASSLVNNNIINIHDIADDDDDDIPFEEALRGIMNHHNNNFEESSSQRVGVNDDDEMTRDFLGIGVISQREFFNISGLHHHQYGSRQQNQNQPPSWQG